ncbi:hypothetical protein [Niastella sp. OAS944]|uniref:hypothetical protein n=1 Tax=Niastella sp. OAS944 TaxID=2664089 RepID=UPI003488FED2|nr:hypothetical protein [Chitinophagaceae bacterium OAS944]
MDAHVVEVKLSVEENETMTAHLVFRNKSGNSIYLNKQVVYYDGQVRNNYFEIENSNGDEIDYLGMMANCTRTPDEYILLQPGEEISSAISLKEFYELNKGNNYKVQYDAINPGFKDQHQPSMEMQSNKVEISY